MKGNSYFEVLQLRFKNISPTYVDLILSKKLKYT